MIASPRRSTPSSGTSGTAARSGTTPSTMPRAADVRHWPVPASTGRRRVARRVERVLAGGQLDRQVHGRHEPLVGGPAAQVGVGGGQEPLRGTEPSTPPNAPDSSSALVRGVHALARTRRRAPPQGSCRRCRNHEVAAERGAAGRAEHHGGPPAVAELGQRALGADAVAQLDHHPVGAQPGCRACPGCWTARPRSRRWRRSSPRCPGPPCAAGCRRGARAIRTRAR